MKKGNNVKKADWKIILNQASCDSRVYYKGKLVAGVTAIKAEVKSSTRAVTAQLNIEFPYIEIDVKDNNVFIKHKKNKKNKTVKIINKKKDC